MTNPKSPATMTRRHVLTSIAALSALSLSVPLIWPEPVFAQDIAPARFLKLSGVLTGREQLDPIIAERALQALTAEDAGFPAQAERLALAIDEANFRDMRQFRVFIANHSDLEPVAMKIISAWYLGYTGVSGASPYSDTARFVAYAGALMYQPTANATVVPSYSRGRTDYWAEPPASLAND